MQPFIRINDDLLERLATYFTYHNLYKRYNLTFEKFIFKYQRGDYHRWINKEPKRY